MTDQVAPTTHDEPGDRAKLAAMLLRNVPRSAVDKPSEYRYPAGGVEGDVPSEEVVETDSPADGENTDASMMKAVDLGDQLRRAVAKSGLTRNQIAKETDLSYAIVHGFMAGTSDIRLSTASKIANVVGVAIWSKSSDKRKSK